MKINIQFETVETRPVQVRRGHVKPPDDTKPIRIAQPGPDVWLPPRKSDPAPATDAK